MRNILLIATGFSPWFNMKEECWASAQYVSNIIWLKPVAIETQNIN
jgi:hypothetical protein